MVVVRRSEQRTRRRRGSCNQQVRGRLDTSTSASSRSSADMWRGRSSEGDHTSSLDPALSCGSCRATTSKRKLSHWVARYTIQIRVNKMNMVSWSQLSQHFKKFDLTGQVRASFMLVVDISLSSKAPSFSLTETK